MENGNQSWLMRELDHVHERSDRNDERIVRLEKAFHTLVTEVAIIGQKIAGMKDGGKKSLSHGFIMPWLREYKTDAAIIAALIGTLLGPERLRVLIETLRALM